MNDKIKHLLATAYKTDSIEKNKWRIENREQLREQRKKELKELMEKDKTMSNNKQSMKLYTEEQIKKIQQAILCNHKDAIMDENYCLNVTTPIELPSDKEIKDASIKYYVNKSACFYFEIGAKWMRDKIQGGNND